MMTRENTAGTENIADSENTAGVWSTLLTLLREQGWTILPGPWGNESGDRSRKATLRDDEYDGEWLLWLVDRDYHTAGPHPRIVHDVHTAAWLRISREHGTEERSVDVELNPATATPDSVLSKLRTAVDTDPYTGKRVGFRAMKHVGFAGFASDESLAQARRDQEFPGWTD